MSMTIDEYRAMMSLGLLLVLLMPILAVILMSFWYDRKVRRLCAQCRVTMRGEQEAYCRECWSSLHDKYHVQALSNDRMNDAFKRRAVGEPTKHAQIIEQTPM